MEMTALEQLVYKAVEENGELMFGIRQSDHG